MTDKWVLEDKVQLVSEEDGGMALIAEFEKPDSELWVRLQSWDEEKKHEEFAKFEGKPVRITIEVIE